MRQILKRIEALERKADKEILADALPYAIAYHLGGQDTSQRLWRVTPERWVAKISPNFSKRAGICFASHPTVWTHLGVPSARWPSPMQTSCEVRL